MELTAYLCSTIGKTILKKMLFTLMLTLSSPLKEKKRGRHGEGGCRRCEHLAQRPLVARAWAAQGPKGDPHRLTRD